MNTDKYGRPLSATLGTFTERQAWHRRLAQERPQEPWTDDDQQEENDHDQ